MILRSLLLLFCLFLMTRLMAHGAIPASTSNLSPDDILAKADAIRNPEDSFFMKVRVSTAGEDDALFEVMTKGKGKTAIRTVEPVRDRGRNLLMLDENMFVYIPNLKRAVRISLSQKLTGQAANGDIGRMRWSGDYKAELMSESKEQWELKLSALKKGLTYEQINVTIHKGDFHPLSAKYLAGTGKLLKTVEFSQYKNMAGGLRPCQIIIQSATNLKEKSVLSIENMEVKQFPEALFTQNNLN